MTSFWRHNALARWMPPERRAEGGIKRVHVSCDSCRSQELTMNAERNLEKGEALRRERARLEEVSAELATLRREYEQLSLKQADIMKVRLLGLGRTI
jgi:hypothetical protein